MSDGNSSTLQSYVDQATGMAQRAMGAATGDSATHNQADANLQKAENEHAASHTTAKVGPFAADPNTGATAKDDPSRSNASWDQTVGSTKEAVGNMIGNESLRRAGVEQNAAGKEAEAKGQLKDWGQGIADRAQGTVGGIQAAVTGDREEEQKWRDMHDEGKVRQRGAEADMAKKGGQ
ncbi:uncharacterized protein PFLUO_LOCUS2180 [Penicillium psychrofluorescens]|uniref:uncharacterized protein n=1 Tax=Penicillium psychrofluorescens TaxID=3158075 RepID=UPI003CCD437E